MANMFPKLKYLAGFYISRRFKTENKLTTWQVLKLVCEGIKGFKDGASYEEWKDKLGTRKNQERA
jgi:hypothetical protein